MKYVIVFIINLYRKFISPLFPRCCRFYPTCSAYAAQAVMRFGVIKGGWLSIKRIARCNPYFKGGFDPVPLVYPSKNVT